MRGKLTRLPFCSRATIQLRISIFALLLVGLAALSSARPVSAAHAHPLIPHSGGCCQFFVHQATTANTTWNWTDVEAPNPGITNYNPNAVVVATPRGIYPHPIGVWYDWSTDHWSIFNEDGAAMPEWALFNVFAEDQPSADSTFVHQATTANSALDYTDIDNPLTNNLPTAKLAVIARSTVGTTSGPPDPHALGVWYHNGHWSIFHEDGTPIAKGTYYNVFLDRKTWNTSFVHTATAANSSGSYTCINNAALNGNSSAAPW